MNEPRGRIHAAVRGRPSYRGCPRRIRRTGGPPRPRAPCSAVRPSRSGRLRGRDSRGALRPAPCVPAGPVRPPCRRVRGRALLEVRQQLHLPYRVLDAQLQPAVCGGAGSRSGTHRTSSRAWSRPSASCARSGPCCASNASALPLQLHVVAGHGGHAQGVVDAPNPLSYHKSISHLDVSAADPGRSPGGLMTDCSRRGLPRDVALEDGRALGVVRM
jgi:hypothetical protein